MKIRSFVRWVAHEVVKDRPEPGWRHPLIFFPLFLTCGAWLPGSATVALDSSQPVRVRLLALVVGLVGVGVVAGIVRWYRRG